MLFLVRCSLANHIPEYALNTGKGNAPFSVASGNESVGINHGHLKLHDLFHDSLEAGPVRRNFSHVRTFWTFFDALRKTRQKMILQFIYLNNEVRRRVVDTQGGDSGSVKDTKASAATKSKR
jgi:hypothetical protein